MFRIYSRSGAWLRRVGKRKRVTFTLLHSFLRAEEISQSIRYCNYNLTDADEGGSAAVLEDLQGAGGDLLQAKLDAVLAEARKKQAQTLEQISWRVRCVRAW